jgi:hypothetical protein
MKITEAKAVVRDCPFERFHQKVALILAFLGLVSDKDPRSWVA